MLTTYTYLTQLYVRMGWTLTQASNRAYHKLGLGYNKLVDFAIKRGLNRITAEYFVLSHIDYYSIDAGCADYEAYQLVLADLCDDEYAFQYMMTVTK